MSSIIQSVEELIQATPDRNNQDFFAEMWQVLTSLRERVDQRFPTRLDPSVTDLASYGAADGSTKGHLSASSSDEIDWMVHSFMGTPAHSFSNMHLTIWLGPQVKVPHFGMALGTIPDLFVYSDLVPRTDLMTDLDYLDRYYGPRNDTFLEFEANPEFRPFVSREIYMRVAQSRTSLCYVAKPSTKALTQVSRAAHELLDQWLHAVDTAERVPVEQEEALAARDLKIRRAIAERDPANVMGEKIFGQELTKKLIGALWGEHRVSQRPGSIKQ